MIPENYYEKFGWGKTTDTPPARKRKVVVSVLPPKAKPKPSPKRPKSCVSSIENAQNKQFIWAIKAQAVCAFCGEQRTEILHFHHRRPEDKVFALSQSAGHTLDEIKVETAKCDLLCANCHLSLHYWEKQKV